MAYIRIRLFWLLSVLLLAPLSFADEAKYLSVAYIKSTASDFVEFERNNWVDVHRELVKRDQKVSWLLYRVKFNGVESKYDYVRLNVLQEWQKVEYPYANLDSVIKKIKPDLDVADFYKKTDSRRQVVGNVLYQLLGQSTISDKPAKYIVINEMKAVDGHASRYRELELEYFKPFHSQRIKAGVMNNWQFYARAFPFGSRYDSDYVTLNGFDTWEDIMKNNPPDIWKNTHGDLDFNAVHDDILSKRDTVNIEIWELVAHL